MGLSWRHVLVLALVLTLAVLWVMRAPAQVPAQFVMPAGKTYVQECGACHTAYAPGLLPVRSWHRMMAELENHFGEDASLDEPEYLAILKELETLAADGVYADQRMRRISAALAPGSQPQRITQTAYWRAVHADIPAAVWQRRQVRAQSNCIACHPRANQGHYAELDVRVPPP